MVTSEITSVFTTRGVRFLKLTKCWNIAVFRGFTDEKFGFLGAIWP